MVNCIASEIVGMGDFAHAWRLTDSRWDKLGDDLLGRIHPLSPQRCREVEELSKVMRNHGPYTPRTENYHIVSGTSLVEETEEDSRRILQWLSSLPIKEDEGIYVNWGNIAPCTAVVTDWDTFRQVWSSFWYPFDVVDVFDDSLNWGVLLGQEEHAVYVERGAAS